MSAIGTIVDKLRKKGALSGPLSRRAEISILGAMLVATALIHSPLLFGSFVEYDDATHIFRNPIVKDLSWTNFKEVLFTNFMGRAASPAFAVDIVNWYIGGGRYAYFAAFNIFWLLVATLLFYRFSALFLTDKRWRLIATALFSFHSVNVDTIAWMSARCHFFGATFILAAFILWQKYVEEINRPRRVIFYFLAFFFAGIAIWNKGIFMVGGPLICVYDVYRRRRISPWVVLDKLPFALVAVIPFFNPPISVPTGAFLRPAIGPTIQVTLLNDTSLIVEYLIRAIVPGPTAIGVTVYAQESLLDISSNETITMMGFPPLFNIGVIGLLFTAAFLAMKRFHLRQPFYALVFIVTGLLPVMNIPPRWVEFAYRFAFLPSIFMSIAVVAILAFTWTRIVTAGRIVVVVLIVLLIGGHMWQTVQNSAAWWSNYSYWKNCTENLPDNLVCRFKLAIEHQDNDRIKQMLQEYKKMLQYSVKYNPIRDFNPAFQLGRKYRDIGDVENACYYFNNALNVNRLNPNMRKSARSYCQKNCEKYMPKAHRK